MKVIWITGASSGIGRALAKEYDNSAHHLILSSRNEAELLALQQELDCESTVLPLDVSDEAAVKHAAEQVLSRFGKVDCLLNSAGISQRSLVQDTGTATGKKIMDVNFFGTVHMVQALLPSMLEHQAGEILVISSPAGKFGFPRRSYYSASKHALHGFFDTLKAELGTSPIHIMFALPGRINTGMAKNALTGDGSAYNKVDPRLAGGLSAEECARIIRKNLRKKKHEVYYGGKEVLLIYIKRFIPALYRKIARSSKVQ